MDKKLGQFVSWMSIGLPLVGLLILMFYGVYEDESMIGVGIYYLLPATCLNLVALIVLTYLGYKKKKNPSDEYLASYSFGRNFLFLLLSYPFGLLCLAAGFKMTNNCWVHIENKSNQRLEKMLLVDSAGQSFPVADLEPGASSSTKYEAIQDASVKLVIGSLNKEETVLGYVSRGWTADTRVEITPKLEIFAFERDNVSEEVPIDHE